MWCSILTMIVEIKGRELTATYHQGRLYMPKSFRDMFGLKDNDILVIKVVEHSHANLKKRPNKNFEKKDNKEDSPILRPDLKIPNMMDDSFPKPRPFNIGNEEEETPWGDDE